MNHPEALKNFPLAHLAIAVTSLADAAPIYAALGFTLHDPEIIEREHVRAQLVIKEALRIELLEPHPVGIGPIAKFLEKRGPGLHHVALTSRNINEDLTALAKIRVTPLKGYPATGMSGSQVAFLDPKTTGGVLFELVSYP
jgi:methylmalonyl-CoA epimerase